MNTATDNPPSTPTASNKALVFIFCTILIDVIGIGIIYPVMQPLLEDMTGEPNSRVAYYIGMLTIAYASMQFVFSPLLGELSDRFGRRPVLLVSLFALGIDYIFHAFAPTLALLFVGRIIAGIGGASFTVATAYIADVSTKENKAKNFGLIGAAFGLGFILGPLIGGIFVGFGVKVPFLVAAGLTLLNFVFGFLFVPESLSRERRREIRWQNTIPGLALIHLSRYKSLVGLILAFVLVNLGGQVMPTTWHVYTVELFGWTGWEIGLSLALIGLLVGLVQGLLTGLAVKKLGIKRAILTGFVLWMAGMIMFTQANAVWMLLIALVPYCLGGIAGPSIQGLMSNQVSEQEQGNLQGVLTSLVSLTAIIGPLLYTMLFEKFTEKGTSLYMPGIAFLAGAIIIVIATVVAFISMNRFTENQETILDTSPDENQS